jgi:large subunit ribosomal protein L25
MPAVVYGHGHASQAIQLEARAFDDLRRHAGRNALVDLKVGGGRAMPVLLHHVQEHPVNRRALHADFLVVKMTEELTVDVPIAMVGESVAVDKEGGTLLHLRDTVQVRALPGDLPSSLELDVTPLDSFDVVLHVSDLQVPDKVTLLTDPTEPLARVQPPRLEVEPTTVEEAAEGEAEAGAEAGEEGAAAEGGETAGSDSEA